MQKQASKTLKIAYELAKLALDDNDYPYEDEDSYSYHVILDFLSLYHVIRHGGVIHAAPQQPTEYAQHTTNRFKYSSLFYQDGTPQSELRRLYNRFMDGDFKTPDFWPRFQGDYDLESYNCPLPSDLVTMTPGVRSTLDQLLGHKGRVIRLPVFNNYDHQGYRSPKADNMTHGIMRGFHELSNDGWVFVAIKSRRVDTQESSRVYLHHMPDTPNQWRQSYTTKENVPSFFESAFTDASGNLIPEQEGNFRLLQTLIKNGHGKDAKGIEWEIIDYPI